MSKSINIYKSGDNWYKTENGVLYICKNPEDVIESDDIMNEMMGVMEWVAMTYTKDDIKAIRLKYG